MPLEQISEVSSRLHKLGQSSFDVVVSDCDVVLCLPGDIAAAGDKTITPIVAPGRGVNSAAN